MNILILTEGGNKIGLGHISRCFALAQHTKEFKGRNKVTFVINGDLTARNFLNKQGIKPLKLDWLKNRRKVLNLASESDVIIIDSYLATPGVYSYLHSLSSTSKPCIVAIDDCNRIRYDVDIVVNPSMDGDKLDYRTSRSAHKPLYLGGKEYIILRKEFNNVPKRRKRKKPKEILITLGGTRCVGFRKRLLGSLHRRFPDSLYHIIVNNVDLRLKNNFKFKVHSGLSASQMRELILKCDIAISGGGQTLYELARLKLPTIGICFADNQRLNLEGMHKRGIIKSVGYYKDPLVLDKIGDALDSFGRRKNNSCRKDFIDAKGTERILDKIFKKSEEKKRRGIDVSIK